ncbi:MAG: multicopper oxidase domain-containing protein [Candidatus Sulfotelmatobacter sp.]|jgi:FtsP/CotA-like multicopper oxidase with cupredoxin domain
MRAELKMLLAVLLCGFPFLKSAAQCPGRPKPGSVVKDALSLTSQNGVLNASFTMGTSVDELGYTHYCYKYQPSSGPVAEAPTLRLNPGDLLQLSVTDDIVSGGADSVSTMMDMSAPTGSPLCGDGGTPTINSTNVHFHGLNVPPVCHQDDVLSTIIQPGSPGFQYGITIPTTEPPGLYWYHPHVHGFTEFQVNGGAAGALIVEGMEKVRPEVTGLTERVFVLRQQYLVPWVPGPYQVTINYQTAGEVQGPSPVIEMKVGEKEFWRVANATIQDFMPLQVWFNGVPQPLQVVALDGYPLAQTRMETTILVPPAGRAEFIVPAPPAGTTVLFLTQAYSTGPTGNQDFEDLLAKVNLTKADTAAAKPAHDSPKVAVGNLKFAGLNTVAPTATRNLYFSEEFGGTNGPIQFYITVGGQKPTVFEPNEKPVITTNVGAVEDWTIENRALETHAFHIHQIHFMMLEVDGKPVTDQDLRDTIEIPYWSGSGPYHSVKVRMDFRDPTIAGTFVFHCHILLHEDLGMMHKIQVMP